MAIFSLNHRPIGRRTHKPGRAGSHIRYIARPGASPEIISNGISKDWRKAKKWFDEQERNSRKNGRVADRIMIALPIELDNSQRITLVKDYLKDLTNDQIPYFVAIHQEGKDRNNPHAHILLRDKSLINGRRLIKTSEKGSTMILREKWTESANKALREANLSEEIQITHKSYKDQGIEKEPSKHLGLNQKKWRYKMRDQEDAKRGILRAYI